MVLPREPVLFMKRLLPSADKTDNVAIPRGSEKSDWELNWA